MSKSFERVAIVAAFCMLSWAAPAAAGPIVLSGDENITDALVGNGVATDAGNQRFFANLLGRGTRVLVQGTDSGGIDTPVANVDAFYGSLAGVTSTVRAGRVTAASLAGVDLYVAAVPADAFTNAEVRALTAFSAAGGTLLLLGDGVGFAQTADFNLNVLLQALGSTLRIAPGNIDTGFRTATGSQIVANPLTLGVATLSYAYVSQVIGGTALFYASNGQPFVTVEGGIVAAAVPEPSTAALAGIALAGLIVGTRRRRR